jgi:hypothetical protein
VAVVDLRVSECEEKEKEKVSVAFYKQTVEDSDEKNQKKCGLVFTKFR